MATSWPADSKRLAIRLPMAPRSNTAMRMGSRRLQEIDDLGLGAFDVADGSYGIAGSCFRRNHPNLGDAEKAEQEFEIGRDEIRSCQSPAISARTERCDD